MRRNAKSKDKKEEEKGEKNTISLLMWEMCFFRTLWKLFDGNFH